MSIEDARKVRAAFAGGGAAFTPPPRTIEDIIALLDEAGRTEPNPDARHRADAMPPATANRDTLAEFYRVRGWDAALAGRAGQALDDLVRALGYAKGTASPDLPTLFSLSVIERIAGNHLRHVEIDAILTADALTAGAPVYQGVATALRKAR